METQYDNTNFLARWIAGELSVEELEAFKKTKEYSAFNKINKGAQRLKAPVFNKEAALNRLKKEVYTQKSEAPKVVSLNQDHKRKPLLPYWVYGIAAAVLVFLGVFKFINSTSSYETGYGEQLAVTLPDNSKVQLNSNSKLDYKTRGWTKDRVLNFSGEAFFDVEKGATFKVKTSQGIVTVLGTEFNVISNTNYFEVTCHEGKVSVTNPAHKNIAILTQGKGVRVYKNSQEKYEFKDEKPTWITGESTFVNTPILEVIKALENTFNIRFNTKTINANKRFTGGFTHKDLNVALKTVFLPMNIAYTRGVDGVIILKEK